MFMETLMDTLELKDFIYEEKVGQLLKTHLFCQCIACWFIEATVSGETV